jgi:hypothetical protein
MLGYESATPAAFGPDIGEGIPAIDRKLRCAVLDPIATEAHPRFECNFYAGYV